MNADFNFMDLSRVKRHSSTRNLDSYWYASRMRSFGRLRPRSKQGAIACVSVHALAPSILFAERAVISSLRTGEVITVCCQVSPVAGRGATIETRRGFQPTVIDWTEPSSSRSDD
jgi:hypothetical protein